MATRSMRTPAIGARRGRGVSSNQLTFTGFVDGLARRAEVNDPMGPAVRVLGAVLALLGLGLVVQASHAATTLGPTEFDAYLVSEAALRGGALVLLLVAWRIGPLGARRVLPFLVLASGLCLLLCYVPPISAPRNGSHRWIELFGFGFQPSELARIALVLWVADRCVRLGPLVYDMRRGVAPMLALALTFFGLVLFETDLGGAMLLLICALSTMWVGGARALPMAASLVAVGGGTITALSLLVPYVRDRVGMWFGNVPNAQVASTLEGLAGGQLTGAGLGSGRMRTEGVPYLNSDYVYAQVGEELGLFGLLVVAGLFACFLWNALRLVLSLRDRFCALAAFGLLISVGLQAMLHMQVVAGLAPPKGTTLPFLSDGGSSLFVSSLAVGLALGSARRSSTATSLRAGLGVDARRDSPLSQESSPCNPSSATASSPCSSS